jgi:hypothetical protein
MSEKFDAEHSTVNEGGGKAERVKDCVQRRLSGFESVIHHRDTEDTEDAQRVE